LGIKLQFSELCNTPVLVTGTVQAGSQEGTISLSQFLFLLLILNIHSEARWALLVIQLKCLRVKKMLTLINVQWQGLFCFVQLHYAIGVETFPT